MHSKDILVYASVAIYPVCKNKRLQVLYNAINNKIVTSAALIIKRQRRNLVFMHLLATFEKLMWKFEKAI